MRLYGRIRLGKNLGLFVGTAVVMGCAGEPAYVELADGTRVSHEQAQRDFDTCWEEVKHLSDEDAMEAGFECLEAKGYRDKPGAPRPARRPTTVEHDDFEMVSRYTAPTVQGHGYSAFLRHSAWQEERREPVTQLPLWGFLPSTRHELDRIATCSDLAKIPAEVPMPPGRHQERFAVPRAPSDALRLKTVLEHGVGHAEHLEPPAGVVDEEPHLEPRARGVGRPPAFLEERRGLRLGEPEARAREQELCAGRGEEAGRLAGFGEISGQRAHTLPVAARLRVIGP